MRVITLSGREVDKDIKIIYTGLHPGEKLYEELITEGEGIVETNHEKIMVLRGDGKFSKEMASSFRDLAGSSKLHDAQSIKRILSELVAEYAPDFSVPSVVDNS